jgi:hypothetical protein
MSKPRGYTVPPLNHRFPLRLRRAEITRIRNKHLNNDLDGDGTDRDSAVVARRPPRLGPYFICPNFPKNPDSAMKTVALSEPIRRRGTGRTA